MNSFEINICRMDAILVEGEMYQSTIVVIYLDYLW